MKKTSYKPPIFGEHIRPVTELMDLQELESYNTIFASYGISIGEEIKFPPCLEQTRVFIQAARNFPDEKMVHVLIERNGQPSYISIGALHKSHLGGMEYACGFSKTLDGFPNDYERLKFLVGKTIKAIGFKEFIFVLNERSKYNPLFFTNEFNKKPRALGNTRAPVIEIVCYYSPLSNEPKQQQPRHADAAKVIPKDILDSPRCTDYSQGDLDNMYQEAYEGNSEAEWNTE